MVRIENWSIGYDNFDPYCPPEQHQRQLCGEVYGHPLQSDGKQIRTSNIEKKIGNTILTRTGTVYTLGKPSEDYVKWCEEQGFTLS